MSRARNRSEARRVFRRRLEAQGYGAEVIERMVAQREVEAADRYGSKARLQRLAEQEAELYQAQRHTSDPIASPDDSRYRPARPDPLTVGAGRVSGETAKAVRRGKTITAWEYQDRSSR